MKTAVDFYILDTTSKERAWLFVCEYLEQHHTEKKCAYVYTTSETEAIVFDDLLWTFKDDAFLAHHLSTDSMQTPICIGYDQPSTPSDTLINLTTVLPDFYEQFPHIVEIIFTDPTVQEPARERYKQYRSLGYHLSTHQLKVS
ncbi:MAG TPA: DNA polymerase III subunit chi [Gammaproteobacteria bacterium]|jgi:DNA polymerase-3 subunit chi|nr:DNA polymerase III subunit chi [Gammaproteobacteria bacterium]